MSKEIVLITGCCGRVGSALAQKLKEKYLVIGLDLPSEINTSCLKNTIEIDLRFQGNIHDAFEKIRQTHGKNIASVIHLAAFYSFAKNHSPLYEEITVKGTQRILEELQLFDVDQFIFTSTMLVHAPTKPGTPITEDSPIVPKWEYPLSKVQTEKIIHEHRGNISTVNLRIAGVYDDGCHSIPISHQIQRIYEKKFESMLFAGNIHHGAAFVHMDDVIDAIILSLEKRKAIPGETSFLIGEDNTLSYDKMQRMISSQVKGKEIKTYSVPKWFAKFGAFLQNLIFFKNPPFIQPWMIDFADDHYELAISHAKQMLGWSPKHSIAKTLPKMIQKLKKDPIKWYHQNALK